MQTECIDLIGRRAAPLNVWFNQHGVADGVTRSWARKCAFAGALSVVLTIALAPWNPTQSCGVPSIPPIVGFELATSTADLANVFGHGACRTAMISSLRIVNFIDFAFMASYGAFLFFGVSALRARADTPLVAVARVAALAAPCADAVENVCLLSMSIDAPGAWLSVLMVASRAKFLLIGLVALAVGVATWRTEASWGRLLAVAHLPALPVVLVGISLPAAMPAILPAIAASWLCLLAWAIRRSMS